MFIGVSIVAIQDAGNAIWPIFGAAHIPHRCGLPGLDSEHFTNVSGSLIHSVFFNSTQSLQQKPFTV